MKEKILNKRAFVQNFLLWKKRKILNIRNCVHTCLFKHCFFKPEFKSEINVATTVVDYALQEIKNIEKLNIT